MTEAEKAEKSRQAAIKLTNFSIAALISKSEDDEIERRKRFLQTMPMLGKKTQKNI